MFSRILSISCWLRSAICLIHHRHHDPFFLSSCTLSVMEMARVKDERNIFYGQFFVPFLPLSSIEKSRAADQTMAVKGEDSDQKSFCRNSYDDDEDGDVAAMRSKSRAHKMTMISQPILLPIHPFDTTDTWRSVLREEVEERWGEERKMKKDHQNERRQSGSGGRQTIQERTWEKRA